MPSPDSDPLDSIARKFDERAQEKGLSLLGGPASELFEGIHADPESTRKFRFWHIEGLLVTASELLERCLQEDARFEALRAQGVVQVAQRLLDELSLELDLERDGKADDQPSGRAVQIASKRLADSSKLEKANIEMFEAYHRAAGLLDGQTEFHLRLAQYQAQGQAMGAAVSREERRDEIASAVRDQAWAQYDAHAKRSLLRASRAHLEQLKGAFEPGGALDYAGHVTRSRDRLRADLRDALNRLQVAGEGMRKLLHYPGPASGRESLKWDAERVKSTKLDLNEVVSTCRQAVRWLAMFAQTDQMFTVVVSLRRELERAGLGWNDAKNLCQTEKDGLGWRMPANLLSDHRFIRLRGLSARIVTGNPTSVVTLALLVPREARILPQDEGAGDDHASLISQDEMPWCRLGRVEPFESAREPEVAGAISLMNASPIGVDEGARGLWRLRLIGATEAEVGALEDILVELHLVGQPPELRKG